MANLKTNKTPALQHRDKFNKGEKTAPAKMPRQPAKSEPVLQQGFSSLGSAKTPAPMKKKPAKGY